LETVLLHKSAFLYVTSIFRLSSFVFANALLTGITKTFVPFYSSFPEILFIIVDTADVCRFVRYGLAAFFVFILFVFWPYGFIWLSLFFFVVNLVLPYG